MATLAELEIRILSGQVDQANRRLANLERQGGRSERATDRLTGSFKGLLGSLLAVVSATAALSKLVDVTRSFDKLNAGITTATGSADNAAIAFEAIQDFASKTPFDLAQATQGFVQLVNLGLNPSERALTSYGNTASALGKDLDQMIEAVADAATGEFERLKEFGIRSSKQGDQVAFTFRGVTETVKLNAESIEGYLIALGETNFGDAMANQMATLDGAMANLDDEWNKLFLNISNAGIGDVIESYVRQAISTLEELNSVLVSGQIQASLKAILGAWSGWAEDVRTVIKLLSLDYEESVFAYPTAMDAALGEMIGSWGTIPIKIRAFLQVMVAEAAASFEQFGVIVGSVPDLVSAVFTDDTFQNVSDRIDSQIKVLEDVKLKTIGSITDQAQASIDIYDREILAAQNLADEYDRAREAKRKLGGDRLAQFAIAPDAPDQSEGGSSGSGNSRATKALEKSAADAKKIRQKDINDVIRSLRTREEAIEQSYLRQRGIIEQNTTAGSELQDRLLSRSTDRYIQEMKRLESFRNTDLENVRRSLETEEKAIQASVGFDIDTDQLLSIESEINQIDDLFTARREAILNNESLTQEALTDLILQATHSRNAQIIALETEKNSLLLNSSSHLFNSLAGIAKGYAGDQSAAYQALFAVSKAFAIADSIIKIQQGIAQAVSLGFPLAIPAVAAVVAESAAILSTITGTSFSGGRDQGGTIQPGQFAIVGERGAEFVRSSGAASGKVNDAQIIQALQIQFPGLPGKIQSVSSGINIVGQDGPRLIQGPATVTSRRDTASILSESKFSGIFETGGHIPLNGFGIIGESGPEFVVNPGASARSNQSANNPEPVNLPSTKSGTTANNITIVNAVDTDSIGNYLESSSGQSVIRNVIQMNSDLIRDISVA